MDLGGRLNGRPADTPGRQNGLSAWVDARVAHRRGESTLSGPNSAAMSGLRTPPWLTYSVVFEERNTIRPLNPCAEALHRLEA